MFVWAGSGTYAGTEVRAGEPGRDELVVTHGAAVREHTVANDGTEELVAFTFFGPDLQVGAPRIPAWRRESLSAPS